MSHVVRLTAALALLLLLVSPLSAIADDSPQNALVEVTIDDIGEAPAGLRALDLLVTVERVVAGNVPGTSLIVRVPDGERAPGLELGERVRLALAPGNDGSFRIRRIEREGGPGGGADEAGQAVTVAIEPPPLALRTGEAVAFHAVFSGPARSARWETEAGAFAFSEAACAADTFCAHHVFTRPGTYQVKVTATGAQGQSAEATRTVVVEGDEVRLKGRESLLQSVLSAPLGAAGKLQSDVWLHNAGDAPVLVRATFVPRGLPTRGGSQAVREVTVSPGTSVFLPDVLGGLFGEGDQQGSLSLAYLLPLDQGEAAPQVFAYSRSAAEPLDPEEASRFGQLIPEEPEATWSAAERIVTGILEGNGYVGTVAAVNLEGVGGQVTVTLEDADGDPVGRPGVLTLAPRTLRMQPLSRLFPDVVGRRGPFTARFASNGIRFTASTTLLEVESEDQVFLPAAPVTAGAEGDLFVPRVVRGRGQLDTFQTSRLTAFNPADQGRLLTLEFWERGQDNTEPRTAYRFLEPGRSLIVGDVLRDLFGVDEGIGALRVNWSGAAGPAPRLVSTISTGAAGSGGQLGALGSPRSPAPASGR
jgi:surface-anchored protein